jgi:hypothetical protein
MEERPKEVKQIKDDPTDSVIQRLQITSRMICVSFHEL